MADLTTCTLWEERRAHERPCLVWNFHPPSSSIIAYLSSQEVTYGKYGKSGHFSTSLQIEVLWNSTVLSFSEQNWVSVENTLVAPQLFVAETNGSVSGDPTQKADEKSPESLEPFDSLSLCCIVQITERPARWSATVPSSNSNPLRKCRPPTYPSLLLQFVSVLD